VGEELVVWEDLTGLQNLSGLSGVSGRSGVSVAIELRQPEGGGAAGDLVDEAAEDEGVDGVEGVPVEEAEMAFRGEEGGLGEKSLVAIVRRDLELEPGIAGHLHLGAQAQQAAGLDAPEVEGVAGAELIGMAAPAAQADAAHEPVEEAAQRPGEVEVEPATVSAEAGEDLIDIGRGGVDDTLALLADHPFLVGENERRHVPPAGAQSVTPGGLHVADLQAGQRALHGGAIAGGRDVGEELAGQGIADDGLVAQPLDERTMAAGANAGSNPVAEFRAIVSCLAGDGSVQNVMTDPFPATTGPARAGGGNASIRTQVALPQPCIAPIVFVTSPGGAWFAATGG
jgi:hypothetical protein